MTEKNTSSESMLVRSENLDRLLLLAGEVIIASSNLGMAYRNLQNLYDRRQSVSWEILEALKDLSGSTTDISSNLHHLVQDIRTVDMKDVCFRAKRLARELSRKTGKRIRFDVRGEDTVVDKSIVEKLYDPIEHQLRNAIDHGIEDAETRANAGKPEEGTLSLVIYNNERETFIEIEDDGAGLDMETLRRKAIDAGIINDADQFTEENALEIMCAPGVSTARFVTEISGRGVGMDVIRDRIHSLGGTISFTTKRGSGTCFTFRVPLVSAVNIVDALVVQAAETMYAFPIGSVVATTSVTRNEIHSAFGKGESITYLGNLLPLFNLAGILDGVESQRPEIDVPVLILEYKETKAAFCVDAFLAPQKLVIIPIQETLPIPEFSGATILGGRKLGLIVNVPDLINRALDRRAAPVSMATALPGTLHPAESLEQAAVSTEKTDAPELEESQFHTAAGAKITPERREFLMEIERLAPTLNEALFNLESNPSGRDPINLAFRLFHTIKGNFIMIGLPLGGATIHSVESVLDRVRSSKQPVTPEIIDILMDAASFIEEAVRASLAGTWSDKVRDDIQTRAQGLMAAFAPSETVSSYNSDEIILSHEAAYRAVIHRKRRVTSYLCHVKFDPGLQPAFLVASLIYRRFCDLGDVLGSKPSLLELENGRTDTLFRVRFASSLPYEQLTRSLNTILREHYGATMVDLKRFE